MCGEESSYDVIVVGAGLAGCEAALAASRKDLKTLLLTTNLDTIGRLSFSPVLGDKKDLFERLVSLGGETPKIRDRALQKRALGTMMPLVDKRRFHLQMKLALEREKNLELRQTVVTKVLVSDGRATGVMTRFAEEFGARAVILAPGTFLRGRVLVGPRVTEGGRVGESSSEELSDDLRNLGFKIGRLRATAGPLIRLNGPAKAEKLASAGIFLYPEGDESEELYVEGFPMGLNECEQIRMIQSYPSLKGAWIVRSGYIVEYDSIDLQELRPNGQPQRVAALFFAGRVVGARRYEETAHQGFVTGFDVWKNIVKT
jgi:tRNA U34 5-carboxymethylaminomethyl modifying enzyme MnmG/GidA